MTGGESTQHADLPEMIEKIKAMGFLVKLDSNGSNPEILKNLIDKNLVDYIAMDIKAPLEKYSVITKTKNSGRSIERSVKLIMNSGIEYEFRTTVAKPLLSVNDFYGIGTLIHGANRHYIQNYVKAPKQVDPTITLDSFSDEELQQARDIMSHYVEVAHIR